MKLDTADKIFAQNLIRLREEKRMSQDQLATASGVSVSSIRNYEKCRTSPPIPMLRSLARALRVDFNELLGGYPSNRYVSGKITEVIGDLQEYAKERKR